MIQESLERFREHGAPGSWHVGPSMRPKDLGEHLLAHGFSRGGDDIGMAVNLSALREDLPVPDELIIERVRDEEGLAAWEDTLARGFGEGLVEARWVAEMYCRIGLGDEVPWRHYLGHLRGEPVATSTLFFGAGGSWDLLRLHRRRDPAAGYRSGTHPGAAAGDAGDGLSGRRPGILGDGLPGLPQAGFPGVLQDPDLRVASTWLLTSGGALFTGVPRRSVLRNDLPLARAAASPRRSVRSGSRSQDVAR